MTMRIFPVALILSIPALCSVFSSCKTPESDSSLQMFNGDLLSDTDPDSARVTKIFYQRGNEGQFTSTAFFLTPRILLTSGHSLEGATHSFQIASEGSGYQRTNLSVARKLVSHKEITRRNNRGLAESLDVGILALTDNFAANGFSVQVPAMWPPVPPTRVKIIGTGKNDKDNDWGRAVRIRGTFPLFESSPMILSYDMSQPGSPYTGVGDSGSPILHNDQLVGIHSGNYATNGVVSSGYGTSLFFSSLIDLLRGLGDEYLDENLRLLFARSDYMQCAANDMDMQWRLPLYFSRAVNTDTVHAVLLESADWSTKAPFQLTGMPSSIIADRPPWLIADKTSSTLRLRMVAIRAGTCTLGQKVDLTLLRPNAYQELNLSFQPFRDAISVTLRPGAPDQHVMSLNR
jgi:hypothetical protein